MNYIFGVILIIAINMTPFLTNIVTEFGGPEPNKQIQKFTLARWKVPGLDLK